ncbi:oxygen-independent coproporphyrinogen-3 oxidase [Caloranaerobacter azorensis DSM 13643]|uniref:Oxygen-independent coproporphyrinogen-3 oxidase n=1 Tax=Caloranaerobacter azorensis DSM 13643 TaxID=1121264 RepID=A0A1M5TR51_9FIRM|nr:coproporphyrinogen dehydrogenase HemZ [Caloranaerobacter azorensis]SHH52873.1 oxygen-independent coproporphyrinogen-3 oxidase [Caloranaerobacter azorensis DSM 13643]
MVSVILKGHDFTYEVFELLRAFFVNDEVKFIDEKALVDDQSLLIESILYKNDNYYVAETNIKKSDKLLSSSIINEAEKIVVKDFIEKKKLKTMVKMSIYEAVTEIVETKVPWGILTGVRPTKVVHELIDKGYNDEFILEILLNNYKMFREKAKLILDIAKLQRKYIYPISKRDFSLYISIPFCPTRCLYCSFPSNPLDKSKDYISDYVEKLLYEINRVGELTGNMKINTVYIGGGTPTSIPILYLEKIIDRIQNVFGTSNIIEFTVEAGRPDTMTRDVLTKLKKLGIDRISINPQTMNENTLKLIGRKHSSEDILKAFDLAREIGFNSINMDLIVGLPNENVEDIIKTMEFIVKLKPDNLTVHTMAIKRASKLNESLNDFKLSKQEEIEKMIDVTKKFAYEMGMYAYYLYRQKQILGNMENVGYTLPGKECLYNILIMEEKQTILAVGAGGVSKIFFPDENRIERVPNVKSLYEYLNRVEEMVERKKKFIELLT